MNKQIRNEVFLRLKAHTPKPTTEFLTPMRDCRSQVTLWEVKSAADLNQDVVSRANRIDW